MSVISQPKPRVLDETCDIPSGAIYRLTVEQYHQIVRAGIIGEDEPVELLKGWLVRKMRKNPPHRFATESTREALGEVIPSGWHVQSQEPITLLDSEPEPDVSVIRGSARDYAQEHAGPNNVGLVVEVADTSLARDRGFKKQIYAEARIPVYWIVNLIDRVVEVYTEPSGPGEQPDYRKNEAYAAADDVPVVLDGREVGRIAVRDLLP
jgi:Uma2 family endonuclease